MYIPPFRNKPLYEATKALTSTRHYTSISYGGLIGEGLLLSRVCRTTPLPLLLLCLCWQLGSFSWLPSAMLAGSRLLWHYLVVMSSSYEDASLVTRYCPSGR